MEDKILITGEFDKKAGFLVGFSYGVILGVVFYLVGFVIPLYDAISRTTYNVCTLAIALAVGVSMGLPMLKRELTITENSLIFKMNKTTIECPIKDISSYTLGNQRIDIKACPRNIVLLNLKNCEEVSAVLKTLLDQNNSDSSTTNYSNADELKKFKELLDSGVISQEEFDAKKKQLLGL